VVLHGMSHVAKTARPALGVWRISKSFDLGALNGRPSGKQFEDGHEMPILELISVEAEAEDKVSMVSLFKARPVVSVCL
jgi:hypothetical protein